MIRLEEFKNVWEIIKLEVNDNQKSFIASNTNRNNEIIIGIYLYESMDNHYPYFFLY